MFQKTMQALGAAAVVASLGSVAFADQSEVDRIIAAPVPVGGHLLIRSEGHLRCYAVNKRK